ncbi:23S rRNA (uracil(1939)-C(5))-methyltransferase RlmD [Clostridium aestuarii]|uniref:23S rRNA (Uracil(1939)-C(5))-methyltransferase RlmD n=1 Tax=Clostridium aestuarii TaxID=338193 RepID=A0ABT4CXU2_9CLOT|nr:23S rRNA (uracil(1939)-C(5))-methyltransferase RlmD [Clostridium aestuarii]MCY6483794.1 23S rRNA (uracil(1939)-C(5))-methyltransferase RlmD [Clostridium aestuarii]
MEKIIPIEKNTEHVVEITGLGYEGEGVAKIDNYTIFVQGALLGETVRIKVLKVRKNFGFGKLIEIINPSKDRVEPVCSIYNRCGGCGLQHLAYDAQLKFKTNRVKDCLERIAKLKVDSKENIVLHDTLGMDSPYNYRNKVQLPVREYKNEVKIGFYVPRTHDIIDIQNCAIQDETTDKVVKLTRQWIKEFDIKPYNEYINAGVVRHIMVRRGFKTNETMVVIVTKANNLPCKKEFIELMVNNIEGITSIIQNVNPNKTNVILGEKCKTLWGKDVIKDNIGEFKFNISPLSFFQVNPIQTEVLYNKALEYADLSGEEIVFDAYCGTGSISLFLSQKCKKVYGIEMVPQAIENAIVNAKENNIDNVEFIVGKSEEAIPQLIEEGIKADVVVVDPPRKGCDKVLLEAIAEMKPKKVVYVSCDPGTLARDLNILDELGYETLEVQPVDMFPQTSHIECVVKLKRKHR